jgi:hypothetical protein
MPVSKFSCAESSFSMRLLCLTIFCAFAESFQKSGSEICVSNFSSSIFLPGASKKPPELDNFFFRFFVFCL